MNPQLIIRKVANGFCVVPHEWNPMGAVSYDPNAEHVFHTLAEAANYMASYFGVATDEQPKTTPTP